jgi:hypothetical protein
MNKIIVISGWIAIAALMAIIWGVILSPLKLPDGVSAGVMILAFIATFLAGMAFVSAKYADEDIERISRHK